METKLKKKFESMEMDKIAIFDKISLLDNEFLNKPPAKDKWSIIQILHHLIQAEKATLNYIKKKTQSPEKLQKAGLIEKLKSLVLNYYLKSPKKWKAPAVVNTIPEQDNLENTIMIYNNNRNEWYSFLIQMPDDWARKKIFRHPITGRMDMHMTLDFLNLHAKRHFKQINSIMNDQFRITK
ncbi:DinB family protein [Hyphobacterium sp. CCMP332]|nr:DinB family protein [Hyphobacterium sp. CCMP332]